jgi:hypothetical protein
MHERGTSARWAIAIALTVGVVLFASTTPGGGAAPALAQTAPTLGQAASFAVLAGSTVTNTGSTRISGDVGVSPGSAVTGFPPGTVTNGTIHAADAVATQAQGALGTAYTNLAGQSCPPANNLTGQNLGGRTLVAGVYCFDSSAQLTGSLTLDAQGNTGAVFIFQIGSTLTTASGAVVRVINGASRCNVFWQVGSSATLGTTTSFVGSLLALTSITLNRGAIIVAGRALARNGAVTMDTNNISTGACAAPPAATATRTPTGTPDGSSPTSTPTRTGPPDGTATPGIPTSTATPGLPPSPPTRTPTPTDDDDDDDDGGNRGGGQTPTATASPTASATAMITPGTATVIATPEVTPTPTITLTPTIAATPTVLATTTPAALVRIPAQLPRTGGGYSDGAAFGPLPRPRLHAWVRSGG